MNSRERNIAANNKGLADTKAIFDALMPHRVGFVKVATPLYEKQPSGQWKVVDCICGPNSTTRRDTPDGSCKSVGKHPLGPGWEKHPTQDWAVVKRWLDDGYSIGLYPLAGCRVIGLDEDDEDALAFLFASVGEDLPLMDTLVDQMRGKYHLFMLAPDGYDIETITTGNFSGGQVLRDGLVRQFVAPNMLHEAGRRQWNRVSTLKVASPAFLAAIAASAEDVKVKQEAAKTPSDPGWKVKHPGRHAFLLTQAAKLRNLGLGEDGIYGGLVELNRLRCDPPHSDGHVREIARDYAKKDSTAYEPPITITLNASKNGNQPIPPGRYRTIAQYEPKKVDWLWEGWLPRAEPAILEGLGGVGKSTFVVDLMARLSRGDPMPDGATNPFGQPMSSIYITGEDDPNRVLSPRFRAANADLSLVHFLNAAFTVPKDVQQLALDIDALKDVALVFIDPLFSHIDLKVNPNADAEIRTKVMDPLRQVAHLCDVSVLIARHLNKKSGDEIALRGSGSYGGLTGAARAVLHSMSDPDDDERDTKIIGVIKANYGRMPLPWSFRIEEVVVRDSSFNEIATSRLVWGAKQTKYLDAIADAARSKAGTKGADARHGAARDQADRDLIDILTAGELEQRLVMDEMTRRGHSRDATYNARARCNVEVVRPGKNTGPYVWRLPGQGPGRQGSFGLP